MRAVTVTGMGLVSPVGSSPDEVFDAVCEGRSGITRPPEDHPLHEVVEAAAFCPPIDPTSLLSGPDARVADRSIVLALRAAQDAMADAGIEVGRDVDPYRIAVIVSGVGGLATLAGQAVNRAAKGRLGVTPYLLPASLPNMAAAHLSILHQAMGPNNTIVTACASSKKSFVRAGARVLDLATVVLRALEALPERGTDRA